MYNRILNYTESDVEIGSEDGEFVGPHKIIEIMESVGYKLTSEYGKKSENTNFADPYKVVCLTFKNENCTMFFWTTQRC